MKNKKNLIYLLIYACYSVFITLVLFKSQEARGFFFPDFSKIIIFEDYIVEILFIYLILYPLFAIGGLLIIGYALTPLFFIIFAKITGNKLEYGFQEIRPNYQDKILKKTLLPVLMAINFAVTLSTNEILVDMIGFVPEYPTLEYFISIFPTFTLISLVTLAISLGLFSVIWSFKDTGIVHINTKNVEKGVDQIVEGRALGGTFQIILKGYAGIGAILTYYEFIIIINQELIYTPPVLLSFLLIVMPAPIYLVISSLPALILYEMTKNKRIKMLKRLCKRFNIQEIWEIKAERIEKSIG